MDFFVVRKVLAALVLPPTGPLLLAVIGLFLLRDRPRLGRAFIWLGVAGLLLLSLPVVSHALLRLADSGVPLDHARAREAQAIVILGGGTRRAAPEYGGDTLGRLTLERVRYGAMLARQAKLPVLVTGSSTEAAVMKQALESEFGVAVKWAEGGSRDTAGNARHSAAILLPAGIRRVLLVGHGFDMRRAVAEFRSAGLDAMPAPTVIAGDKFEFDEVVELLPTMVALQGSYYALYELLGETVRRMRAAL